MALLKKHLYIHISYTDNFFPLHFSSDTNQIVRTPTNTFIPTELTNVAPMSWHSTSSSTTSQLTLSPMVDVNHDLVPTFPRTVIQNTVYHSSTHTTPTSANPTRVLLLSSSLNKNRNDSSVKTLVSISTAITISSSSTSDGGDGTSTGISFSLDDTTHRFLMSHPKIHSFSNMDERDVPTQLLTNERYRLQYNCCKVDVDHCHRLAKKAREFNDTLVYLEGPRVYTCNHCRTHLTSHDEIFSKSFHGRHGKLN